jgi:putative solute:sodium symporter small subunit
VAGNDNNDNSADKDSTTQSEISQRADHTEGSGEAQQNARYWKANLRLGAVLLTIWFIVSFGFGILLVEPLNRIALFGFKLGFWWAQQGSIYVFILLIFVYAWAMGRLDRKYDVHDDD